MNVQLFTWITGCISPMLSTEVPQHRGSGIVVCQLLLTGITLDLKLQVNSFKLFPNILQNTCLREIT